MAVVDITRVHNVGIMGHGGVGKTSLVEQLLHDAGVTPRRGHVEEGNTLCDYLPEEIQHQHSIQLKPVHFEWKGARIHIIDHPGYADFVGEIAATAPLLDGIIIVTDASNPVQVGTDNAWKYAEQYGVPRAFLVNKLDRANASFKDAVKAIRETYGKRCVPLVVPTGEGAEFKATVNILDHDEDNFSETLHQLHQEIQDAVAESNEALLEKFLELGQLTLDELHQGLHDGIASGQIVPILAGSVANNVGMDDMLDVVAESFPSPLDRHVIVRNQAGEEIELAVGPEEPFVAQVFRQVVDPFVGHVTMFRVLTGSLASDGDFYNATRRTKERTGKILLLNGKDSQSVDRVGPGDIAALTKLKHTHFGDTLCAVGHHFELPPIAMPSSLVKLAIKPKSRADEDKIGEALHRLMEEDPTFSHYRDEATGEHIIRGMGDLQLEIMLERMKGKFNVEAETSVPKVAYRETIRAQAEAQGRYKKQTGGHGQFGDVHLRLYPNERGAGYEFIDKVVGGVVPKQYIPAVDKGCQEALDKGVISGHPVVDVKCELFFGSYHTVDSSEMAFKVAASMAIQKAVLEARPCIIEPVVELTVTIPEDCMGDITGDLTSRRGRILGLDAAGPGRQCVKAHVPEAEVLRYGAVLRGMSGGRGSYSVTFSHYDEVPDNIARELIAEYEKAKANGH